MLEPNQGRPPRCGSVRDPLRELPNLDKIGLVATSTAAMIASVSRGEGIVSATIQLDHQHALARADRRQR
jgi:hypothetical protein